jgi:hypothetical protein
MQRLFDVRMVPGRNRVKGHNTIYMARLVCAFIGTFRPEFEIWFHGLAAGNDLSVAKAFCRETQQTVLELSCR